MVEVCFESGASQWCRPWRRRDAEGGARLATHLVKQGLTRAVRAGQAVAERFAGGRELGWSRPRGLCHCFDALAISLLERVRIADDDE